MAPPARKGKRAKGRNPSIALAENADDELSSPTAQSGLRHVSGTGSSCIGSM